MELPTWEEFLVFLTTEKNMTVTETTANKFYYLREFFADKPFIEENVKHFFKQVRLDTYYRYEGKDYATNFNDYILLIKYIHEYNKKERNELRELNSSGSVKLDITWEQLKQYLEMDQGITPGSSNKAAFKKIREYFFDKDFNRDNFRDFLIQIKEKYSLVNASINKYINVARHIDGYIGTNVLTDFKRLKVDEQATKDILSDSEMEKIATCFTTRTRSSRRINTRYSAALQLLRFTGMRPAELSDLKWENDKGSFFELVKTKTNVKRIVPIPEIVRSYLNRLEKYPHNYVFGSVQGQLKPDSLNKEIKLRCQTLGIEKEVTAYTFRYSVATLCALSGGERTLPRIAKIMGHTMETSYKHYQQYDDGDLMEALNSSHPGLNKSRSILDIKKLCEDYCNKLIDTNKYIVKINITEK